MATQEGWKQELRQRVITALGDRDHAFHLTDFITEFGLDSDTVVAVAEALYSRTYVQCLADQVISSHESSQLQRLAGLLDISDKRAAELMELAGQKAYQNQHAKAMADGKISDDERAQLKQLLGTIAGQAGTSNKPQNVDARKNTASHQESVAAGNGGSSKLGRSELVNQAMALGITNAKGKNMTVLEREIDAVRSGAEGMVDFDAAGFQNSFIYKSKSSAQTVIGQLSSLRSLDKQIEAKRQKLGVVRFVGIALGVSAVGIGFLVLNSTSPSSFLLGLCAVLLTAGVLAVGWSSIRLSGKSVQDVPDRRYEAALGILKLLSKDLARDSLLDVHVDFRPHNHRSKKVRTGKVGYWNVKFHVDNWLVIRGAFADGTKFSMMLIEKHQDRSRKKRSASGKIKHKSKTKTASEAILRLKIKPKKNPELGNGWQGKVKSKADAVQLPPWTQRKSLDAKGDRLTLRSTTKLSWDAVNPVKQGGAKVPRDGVKWMAMMFMSLYGVLDAVKGTSKGGSK